VQSYFPSVARPLLRASIARYRALGVWGRNPILPRAGYERLQDSLISARFVKEGRFEQAVDNGLALEVVRADPPTL